MNIRYLLLILLTTGAYGGELILGGGLSNNDDSKGQRLFRIEYLAPINHTFFWKAEGGVFNGYDLYTGLSLGFQAATTDGLFARYSLGPSYVANTDYRLSSNFEFNHDFELGIRDKSGLEISIGLKHMSNAGLVPPNNGRDFVTVGVGVHF